jgi:aconitate hydratase
LPIWAPEYGATLGIFPVDEVTTGYLKLTGRTDQAVQVETYYKDQGLWYSPGQAEPRYSDALELDLATVEPCLAGPARPQDRVILSKVRGSFRTFLSTLHKEPLKSFDQKAISQWQTDSGQSSPFPNPETSAQHPDAHLGVLGKSVPVKPRFRFLQSMPWLRSHCGHHQLHKYL